MSDPSTSELKEALKNVMPEYVAIDDFEVEASQNLGNEVDPRFGARFRSTVETTSPLYVQDASESGVVFVRQSADAGSRAEVYGKTWSTLFQGEWKHDVKIDGDPLLELGKPLGSFSADRVIIRGSKEEDAYLAEQKEIKEQLAAAEEERRLAELQENLKSAKKILVGVWKDNNSVIEYGEDGSFHAEFLDGRQWKGTWDVISDSLIYVREAAKARDGDWEDKEAMFPVVITHLTNDAFKVRDSNGVIWTAKRVD